MSRNIKIFDALPPYFGGKRRLVSAIFKHAPTADQAPVFADAFMGGGSVSLMAKALGYQVKANDIADRSCIVGKALIENNRTKLEQIDIGRLFVEGVVQPEPDDFITRNYVPEVFLSKHAEFLDNAFSNVRAMGDSPKKWLSMYLLIKFIFAVRPYSKFSSPNAFNIPMEDRRIEHIKNRTYHNSIKVALKPIPDTLQKLAQEINRGIIDNGKKNIISKLDVVEFLNQTKADIVYFDPPYAGTSAYEDNYHVLDEILAGHQFRPEKSEFSQRDGQKFLTRVFEAAEHIPVWILSMGNAGGANECLDDLVEMMKRHRDTMAYRIKYRHMTGAASEEHKKKNQEYLLVGWPK